MTIRQFISRLNWRQSLLQFVGMWFFMHAFGILAILHDVEWHDAFIYGGVKAATKLAVERKMSLSEILVYKFYWATAPGTTGMLAAFIISLVISIKRRWLWVNALIGFVLLYVLSWFDLTGWQHLRHIFLAPGLVFRRTDLRVFSNGSILLALGVFVLFWKRGWRWIEKSKSNINSITRPSTTAHS